MLLCLFEQGYIDVWFGVPPSATVSAALFEPLAGGSLFVGSRSCFWGLDDLSESEAARVVTSILLYMHFMALGEAASARGGGHGWEQPADSGVAPYLSTLAVPEITTWEKGPVLQGLFITDLVGV